MSKVIKADSKVMTPDGKTQLVIGLGATMSCGSDCYPYTVIEFNATGKASDEFLVATSVTVSRDDYKRTDKNGLSESQTYEFVTNPTAEPEKLRWSNKFKCYRTKGGTRVYVGARRAYSDPSF